MDLSEGGTSTKDVFVLTFNATATDAKMGVAFYTSLYTYIRIHSSDEKYALNKRNPLHVKIACFK